MEANTQAEEHRLVEEGYDIAAKSYSEWSPKFDQTRLKYLDKILPGLNEGAECLDIGCGSGMPVLAKLIGHGCKVTGIDISAAQISLAKENAPQATLIQADISTMELANSKYDAILAFWSVIHLTQDHQKALVPRIFDALKPGGIFLLNLSPEQGDSYLENWLGAPKMFWSSLGEQGNTEMLKSANFEVMLDEVQVETIDGFNETFQWLIGRRPE